MMLELQSLVEGQTQTVVGECVQLADLVDVEWPRVCSLIVALLTRIEDTFREVIRSMWEEFPVVSTLDAIGVTEKALFSQSSVVIIGCFAFVDFL